MRLPSDRRGDVNKQDIRCKLQHTPMSERSPPDRRTSTNRTSGAGCSTLVCSRAHLLTGGGHHQRGCTPQVQHICMSERSPSDRRRTSSKRLYTSGAGCRRDMHGSLPQVHKVPHALHDLEGGAAVQADAGFVHEQRLLGPNHHLTCS